MDGSGEFPLGAVFSGSLLLWVSEIELVATRVTTKQLLWMRHFGDILSISSAEIEPVDIITIRSPYADNLTHSVEVTGLHPPNLEGDVMLLGVLLGERALGGYQR